MNHGEESYPEAAWLQLEVSHQSLIFLLHISFMWKKNKFMEAFDRKNRCNLNIQ